MLFQLSFASAGAKLYARLVSWLGACLQVRYSVWRLELTKEHNTRTLHKRAKQRTCNQAPSQEIRQAKSFVAF